MPGSHRLDYDVMVAVPEIPCRWSVIKQVGNQRVLGPGGLTKPEADAMADYMGDGWSACPEMRPSSELSDAFTVINALAHRTGVNEAQLTWCRGKGWRLCFEGDVNLCVESPNLCEAICQGALLVSSIG